MTAFYPLIFIISKILDFIHKANKANSSAISVAWVFNPGLLRRAWKWGGGGNNFHDQLGHIAGHLDQLYCLVGHLDQLHKYKKIQRISQKDKEL